MTQQPTKAAKIYARQHIGSTTRGREVRHPFDYVFWDDGGGPKRVAIVGHPENSPVLLLTDVPEAIFADIQKAADESASKRTKERNQADAATRGGRRIARIGEA